MQTRTRDFFLTVRTEGAILPSDLLERIAAGDSDLGGLTPEAYHLPDGEKITETTNRAWNRLLAAWSGFRSASERLPAGDAGTTLTREKWLLPLFQELGYGRLLTVKAVEIDGKSYAISHGWNWTPIHLLGCHIDLNTPSQRVAGASRSSPHSLLQEFLNRSQEHLWGIVSNGLRLRILRNNASLTRQSYVEFDLEAMMLGEGYSDFVLLWLLCHQSRVEAASPSDCWLEKWSQSSRERGVRALEQLRTGVEDAITCLGRGFLAYPANGVLRARLRSGDLDAQDYYRQVLRLVYRLLFLFVAEDRSLLLLPGEERETARLRYLRYYSTARLRRLAERRTGTRHGDLYVTLRLAMQKLGSDTGCPELALPALGSFLFSATAMPDIELCDIANHDLLDAVRALAVTASNGALRSVDYKNLGAEELGSVYESLLELRPEVNLDTPSFGLTSASGHERKTSGSYYTPTSLIDCLLDAALEPVLDEAVRQPDSEAAILKLKVVDPACGSGHFLIAASHRVAKRLAAARTGGEEPSPDALRKALRDVIGHCIYGVDSNPMAVELCKVNLWLEALDPGKPLSFLDHRIQCGNSLMGATPALLAQGIPDEAFIPIEGDDKEICKEFKRINKDERTKQLRLFAATTEPWQQLGNLAASLMNLDTVGDDSIAAIREKERLYGEAIRSGDYLDGRFWADTWCAAFVWKKTREFSYPITEEVFRRIERNPHACEPRMRHEIERLAGQYRFFHWHLAFPDVFHVPSSGTKSDNEQTGSSGGFDAVLGNPPWEKLTFQDKEWFAVRRPEVSRARNAAERRRMIAVLRDSDPLLFETHLEQRREVEAFNYFVRNSGAYPLCGSGDINTYAAFAELNRNLMSIRGRVGCIVPSGIATDNTTSPFFRDLMKRGSLVSLHSFENEEFIFPAIHHATKFCLLTLGGGGHRTTESDFFFYARQVSDLLDQNRHFTLSADDISLLNPNTQTCMIFRTKRDASINKVIYHRVPLLGDKRVAKNPWDLLLLRMFHMADDSGLFTTEQALESEGFVRSGNLYTGDHETYLPLCEAKMFHHFDHRFGTYEGQSEAQANQGKLPELDETQHSNPACVTSPRYWVANEHLRNFLRGKWDRNWLVGWRDVTSSVTTRTTIAAVIPRAAVGHTYPLIFVAEQHVSQVLYLIANLNSFVVDYCVRQKIGGTHLTYTLLEQTPILSPKTYQERCPWGDVCLGQWIKDRCLELSYSAWDLQDFAKDQECSGPPFRWDESRRFLMRCELDAAYFRLYGVPREDVEYVLESFPLVREKDAQRFGEYRTKRVILEICDAMAQAERTGVAYQTRLDPPPADPRIAYAPAVASQTRHVLVPQPMLVPSLDLVASGAWATPPGIQPSNFVLLAVTEVLHRCGGPVDPHRVWMAVHFVRNPAMALAFLDKARMRDWARVIGPGAQPVQKNVIDISRFRRGATDQLWGDTIIYLKSVGALVESSGQWSVTSAALSPADEEWLAGRADIAVQLASKLADEEETELRLAQFLRSVEDGTARRAVS